MRSRKSFWTMLLPTMVLVILILDANTAVSGAKEGLDLCLNSVIPSLLPFIPISYIINKLLTGKKIPLLRPVGRLCGIPEGAESLLLLGLLGGYPVGAQAINDAYRSGTLPKACAQRLLGFCSNAGPAFIFGMVGSLFNDAKAVWCIWGIHIFSALFVGCILPRRDESTSTTAPDAAFDLSAVPDKSMKTLAGICTWVILLRVVLAFCHRWFLWLLPKHSQVIVTGMLELSNGCHALFSLPVQGERYVLACCMLSLGGLCVGMQTVSVTKDTGSGLYFPGKLLQCTASYFMACASQYYIFSTEEICRPPIAVWGVFTLVLCILPALFYRRKKVVAFPKQMVYNVKKI